MKKIIYLSLIIFGMLSFSSDDEVTYRLTIKGNFKKSVQGKKYFPSNPHFSPIVAVTHNKAYQLFPLGSKSTKGVKDVAETGNPAELLFEIQKAQSKKIILNYNTTTAFDGDEEVSLLVKVNKKNPYISLISMIAPSPDWVVGINKLRVLKQGKSMRKKKILLYAIDAGTDSGRVYSSSDSPTHPQRRIGILNKVGSQSIKDIPFAFLTIERI